MVGPHIALLDLDLDGDGESVGPTFSLLAFAEVAVVGQRALLDFDFDGCFSLLLGCFDKGGIGELRALFAFADVGFGSDGGGVGGACFSLLLGLG